MNTLEKEDIFQLLKENEEEKKLSMNIKKQADKEPRNIPLGRQEIYQSLSNDMFKDGFVMEYPHGNVIRQSDRLFHYRGESACYPTSQPTFIRSLAGKSDKEKIVLEFVASLKLFHFHEILIRLDHYQNFRNIHFTHPNGAKTYLDVLFYNIAQHYGFDTTFLDVTSDFEIALFFACCKFSDNKWEPLTLCDFTKNKSTRCGRIYRRRTADIRNMMYPEERYVVLPVGFQPFMRCHMQYSYAIAMEEDMDLSNPNSGFDCFKFKHSEELSNYIFAKMKKGKLIYPHEGLGFISDELAEIKNSKIFSLSAFNSVYMNSNWGYSEEELRSILYTAGIEISNYTPTIDQTKISLIDKQYKDFDIESTYGIKLKTRQVFTPLPKT